VAGRMRIGAPSRRAKYPALPVVRIAIRRHWPQGRNQGRRRFLDYRRLHSRWTLGQSHGLTGALACLLLTRNKASRDTLMSNDTRDTPDRAGRVFLVGEAALLREAEGARLRAIPGVAPTKYPTIPAGSSRGARNPRRLTVIGDHLDSNSVRDVEASTKVHMLDGPPCNCRCGRCGAQPAEEAMSHGVRRRPSIRRVALNMRPSRAEV